MKKKKELRFSNPLYREIYSNVHYKKRNSLIVVCGNVGTGKSYVALKIASELDPTFTAENLRDRVITSPEQFLNVVAKKSIKLKTGTALIIDEAGTQMYSRQWHSISNQMINYILQTFRSQRLIVIFTLPSFTFLDVHARRLFDYYVETLKINFDDKKTKCKVFKLSYNKMKSSEPYRKYFRLKDPKGGNIVLERFHISKVSDELADAYEKYAGEFKRKISEDALRKAMSEKDRHDKKYFDPREVADKILEKPDVYLKQWQGRTIADIRKIEVDFDIGERRAFKVKRIVEDEIGSIE